MTRRADKRLARNRNLRADGYLVNGIEIYIVVNGNAMSRLNIPWRPDVNRRMNRIPFAAFHAEARQQPYPPLLQHEIRRWAKQ